MLKFENIKIHKIKIYDVFNASVSAQFTITENLITKMWSISTPKICSKVSIYKKHLITGLVYEFRNLLFLYNKYVLTLKRIDILKITQSCLKSIVYKKIARHSVVSIEQLSRYHKNFKQKISSLAYKIIKLNVKLTKIKYDFELNLLNIFFIGSTLYTDLTVLWQNSSILQHIEKIMSESYFSSTFGSILLTKKWQQFYEFKKKLFFNEFITKGPILPFNQFWKKKIVIIIY